MAGGPAGKFSSFCNGFGVGKPGMPTHRMSAVVSKHVRPAPTAPTITTTVAARANATDGLEIHDPTFLPDEGKGGQTGVVAMATRRGLPEAGNTVGLLIISKDGGKVFLDRIEALLTSRFPGIKVRGYLGHHATHLPLPNSNPQPRHPTIKVLRFVKPSFSRPAPPELIQTIAKACNLVVAGLAD